MELTDALARALLREKVEMARRQTPEERMWDGPRLFAGVCARMKDGLRARHPGTSDEELHELLRLQLNRLDTLGLCPSMPCPVPRVP